MLAELPKCLVGSSYTQWAPQTFSRPPKCSTGSQMLNSLPECSLGLLNSHRPPKCSLSPPKAHAYQLAQMALSP